MSKGVDLQVFLMQERFLYIFLVDGQEFVVRNDLPNFGKIMAFYEALKSAQDAFNAGAGLQAKVDWCRAWFLPAWQSYKYHAMVAGVSADEVRRMGKKFA